MRNQAHVAILMPTYNGANHLKEQLLSIKAQTHQNWSLTISDDGSSDASASIIEQFLAEHPERQVTLLSGPQKGLFVNAQSLLRHLPADYDYVAFADQDDFWLPGHLETALRHLSDSPTQPAIYGSRSSITDDTLNVIGRTRRFKPMECFGCAVAQNIISGHSLVMNRALAEVLQNTDVGDGLLYHDWWFYLVAKAIGAKVIYNPEPMVLYRQHGANTLGAYIGLSAIIARMKGVIGGRYGRDIDSHICALKSAAFPLTEEAKVALNALQPRGKTNRLMRFQRFRQHGVKRQSRFENIVLSLGILAGVI